MKTFLLNSITQSGRDFNRMNSTPSSGLSTEIDRGENRRLNPTRRTTAALVMVSLLMGSWGLFGLESAHGQEDMPKQYWIYFGTYTDDDSQGIYAAEFDSTTGEVGQVKLVAETTNPSFLAVHPNGRWLYAVNETVEYQGEKSGFVTAFGLDPATAELTQLNQQPSLGGAPCHLIVDPAGRFVLVANYVGGNVASFKIDPTGQLEPSHSSIQHAGKSVNPGRQEGPHAHSINLDPSGMFAVAADLGTDRLYVHGYDPRSGKLTARPDAEMTLPPGSGPRHFAFHPNGQHAFVINELFSTLSALSWNADKGSFSILQTRSTLPDIEVPGNSTAEVVVHPEGRWVYGSNRGHDSLAIFEWNAKEKRLEPRGHQKTLGKTPRNFAIDPTGRYLFAANQNSDFVTLFRIDAATGGLTEVSKIQVPNPVCVRFLPRGGESD